MTLIKEIILWVAVFTVFLVMMIGVFGTKEQKDNYKEMLPECIQTFRGTKCK